MASKRYTDQDVINAVKTSKCFAEVCRKIGLSERGSNTSTVKKIIKRLNLDISHFTGSLWSKGKTSNDDKRIKKKDLSEIFIQNSNWTSHNIRNKLLKEGLKEHKCEKCERTEWEGEQIPLELHHLNGDHHDNRLENLQILCPNCHAQTDNYSGKSSNKNNNT